MILPFIILYINNKLWLEGHIYKTKKSLFLIKHKEHFWRNVLRVLHSYLRGSTKSIHLEIHFNGEIHQLKTNKSGQFDHFISCPDCISPDLSQLQVHLLKGRHKIRLEVPEPFNHCYFSFQGKNRAVISDIDDTVLVTHTRNTLKKFRTLLVKNAFKRKAVKEMREFYETFAEKGYPFLYVTNSESNLFPIIRLFLEHNRFPIGPVFLKSYVKWSQLFNKRGNTLRNGHKKDKIKFIFKSFPGMTFILIGDDSQKDPEIYAELAREYPERVKEIYIRHVKKNSRKKRIHIKHKIEKEYGIRFNFFMTPSQIIGD